MAAPFKRGERVVIDAKGSPYHGATGVVETVTYTVTQYKDYAAGRLVRERSYRMVKVRFDEPVQISGYVYESRFGFPLSCVKRDEPKVAEAAPEATAPSEIERIEALLWGVAK